MSRIGLIGGNSIEYIDKLIEIWNSGNCAVLIDWRIPLPTAVKMLEEASVQTCYIEKNISMETHLINTDIEFIHFNSSSDTARLVPSEIYEKFKHNYSKDEAVVIYSSGTTGKAKGIILSHFAINTNADSIINYMNPMKGDCIYIIKKISHSSTLTGELLVALKTRIDLVISPEAVIPRVVFKNIKEFNVSIMCLNPALLVIYAQTYRKNKYNISSLKTIYVSGSILNDKVYNLAHETFMYISVYNVYGLSEAGPRVTAQRVECCKGNSVGKPIKGVEISIVNENGKVVEVGEIGIIHVNTPSRFNGYISQNKNYNSYYNDWLNTGDLGYIDHNGELNIVGRIDDVIIIDSQKVYPNEVENAINEHPAVIECLIRDIGNGFIICEYVSEVNCIEADLRKWCFERLTIYEIPKSFIKVDKIERDEKGKQIIGKCE